MMNRSWRVQPEDRDSAGRIRVRPPEEPTAWDDLLASSRIALADSPDAENGFQEDDEPDNRPAWSVWRVPSVQLAILAIAILVVLAMIALLPARSAAPSRLNPPTAAIPTKTAAPDPAPALVLPLAPSAAPTVTLEPSPTDAPPPLEPTACDPLTAPYQVKQQVKPIGSVVGISCVSNDEAQARADELAAAMIATATAEAKR